MAPLSRGQSFFYQLNTELVERTERNARELRREFARIAGAKVVDIAVGQDGGGDEITASGALRFGTRQVLDNLGDHTDVILDISSLPRVTYLSLLTGLLQSLIPDKEARTPSYGGGVNLQVVVAEDAALDARILAEDPSSELVLIPGFASALQVESFQDWPFVWLPILGERRMGQFAKVEAAIPTPAEICPVLPHPSRDPRRADRLLLEYRGPLFDKRETPMTNIIYANEANPFEAYRQLLGTMQRYRESMEIMGGCRLVVTPLGSKLSTVAAGLACFDMRPGSMEEKFCVGISYAQPTRYALEDSPLGSEGREVSTMLLTGEVYEEPTQQIVGALANGP